ncbi:ABC transporter ATP-binding protein [Maritalea mediterranea]|uniref:Sn-glycerol-3-phosphate ABC transporter ATP-binding protein UgpC n=1 Tax=Maritalea mediterranea TaxID=2909667 RepID=A0ABS9E648_9HYPH|nr:sn-glycerol-3-phosphate ABC transporter ATP-binding protein UgpC [Maritalea mediterranea]MCF4097379.1 sn-glycerol-3-phosphate ABC transporter ATP-binding protein UgpC [Maritalea mediterranea]
MATIELRDVTKDFGGVQVIHGANLSIEDNEFVVFVGPSGCGKSTLLRLLSGLEELSAGEIYIDGERIDHLPPARRGLAMVFQSYALYPHMTVYQNMSYALKVARKSKQEIEEKVRAAAEILQLTELLDRKPKALSGGQRQRVAIGRAIVRDPSVFLFDEPLSNLDAKLRVQMRIELTNLHKQLQSTMIYVTHDQVEAMTMADKIVVMRSGHIEQVGAPLDLFNKPVNKFVAGFIGSPAMNFFKGQIISADEGTYEAQLDNGTQFKFKAQAGRLTVQDSIDLGVRPEDLQPGNTGAGTLMGKATAVERLGAQTYAYLSSPINENMIIHYAGDLDIQSGEEIEVSFNLDSCHLFGPDEQRIEFEG